MSVKVGVILVWTGTNASIPTGWERETDLDDKYPKAWGDEAPNTTGGSNTHTHTSDAHTHAIESHSHAVTTDTAHQDQQRGNNAGSTSSTVFHTHNTTVAGVSGGDISDAVTYASANGEPPYYEVIFITPASTPQPFPDDVVGFWNDSTLPTGFSFTDGSGTTPDLRNNYLKGATTDGDAGGTGGSLNHEHEIDHNHTTQSHTHSATSSNSSPNDAGTGSGSPVSGHHTHTITLPSASSATNAYVGDAGLADDVEPSYHKLLTIQNTSGASRTVPAGIIGLWLGSEASIPSTWLACDGTNDTPNLKNKYIKVANTTGQIGDTGGSNSHSHAASNSHTHTATGTHTHSTGGSTSTTGTSVNGISGGSANNDPITHHHLVTSVGNATASYENATVSSNSSSNEPAYRTAAYIQFIGKTGGGFLFNMI